MACADGVAMAMLDVCIMSAFDTPKAMLAPVRMTTNMTPQMASCTKPTSEMPTILPIMSWKGLTLDTISSTMRLVFSSITLCMTMPPYDMTNM